MVVLTSSVIGSGAAPLKIFVIYVSRKNRDIPEVEFWNDENGHRRFRKQVNRNPAKIIDTTARMGEPKLLWYPEPVNHVELLL